MAMLAIGLGCLFGLYSPALIVQDIAITKLGESTKTSCGFIKNFICHYIEDKSQDCKSCTFVNAGNK
jgi:hypothetical protein